MNSTIQEQLRVWCIRQGVYVCTPQPKSLFALPNGDVTEDRAEAREAWELHGLQKNVVRCNLRKKNAFCAGRL